MSTIKIMNGSSLEHSALKQRHRLVRDEHPTSLTLRIHRALSWLNRAEQAEDVDGRFIFLWIAFNAAYASQGRRGGFYELPREAALDQYAARSAVDGNEFTRTRDAAVELNKLAKQSRTFLTKPLLLLPKLKKK